MTGKQILPPSVLKAIYTPRSVTAPGSMPGFGLNKEWPEVSTGMYGLGQWTYHYRGHKVCVLLDPGILWPVIIPSLTSIDMRVPVRFQASARPSSTFPMMVSGLRFWQTTIPWAAWLHG